METKIEHQTLERALMVLDPKRLLYEVTQDGECVARTHTKEWADLIAAAPGLLQACKRAKAIIREPGFILALVETEVDEVLADLHLAIAKAENETEETP